MSDRTDGELKVLVIIPTYNERENLEWIVGRVRAAAPAVDILVADDNSPDGTGEIADELAGADDVIHVLHRAGKAGLGAAYLAGFDWAGEHGYTAVVEMDCDGSHAPEDLPRLIEAAKDADLVIGSRWIRGGRVVNWPRSREFLSRGANVYTRVMLGTSVHDATAGFRLYRLAALQALDLRGVESAGYCFQVDLTWRAVQAGLRVVEIPITFVERERGESKMNGSIIKEALFRVGKWGVVHRADQVKSLVTRRRAK